MQIRVSDYIVQRLEKYGVSRVFMISGGGAMHLNDSIGSSKKISYFCNHHEQAAAIGAEGFARISGKLGVVIVTTGPGGTNTITGVIGQWLDSVPVLYISGQVKQETLASSYPDIGLRQLGDQEINITDIVKPITKFCAIVQEPQSVRYLLEKAVHSATIGRPGPVWLDVPLDIQAAMVETETLDAFEPDCQMQEEEKIRLDNDIQKVMPFLQSATRPVLIAGNGIRIAGARDVFLTVIEKLQIPVVSTFNGCDLIPSDHPLYVGRMGTIGDRAGNLAVQNSDLLLCVGTRNNLRQISYNTKAFARYAKKIVVDIDPKELQKPTVSPDLAIQADAGDFLKSLSNCIEYANTPPGWIEWLDWCKNRQKRYPVVEEMFGKIKSGIHPHYFAKVLSELLPPDQVTVTGNGTVSIAWFQAATVKPGQRTLWNSGCAAMGYDLPAAIGASLARDGRETVICLAGDGSLQMNIQEFGTLAYHQLPVKVFVFNNHGYFSIQQTQNNFFAGRHVASGPDSGVGVPDFCAIAQAYQIPAMRLENQQDLSTQLAKFLQQPGPGLCEVMVTEEFVFSPKVASRKMEDGRMVSRPLEDMWPFLPRDEYLSNLLIPEWVE